MAERPDSPSASAEASPQAPARSAAQYRGFLFADLRGYTEFVEGHGNAAAADLLEAYRLLTRAVVARHDGAEIKTEGDSFYVVFPSASAAVLCAVELVTDAAEASRHEPGRPIRVGVGVHAGETVETSEGFVGAAVNLAARVCAQAGAGEVIVTETVRSMVGAMLDLSFKSIGKRRLKGVHEPVLLYQVAARSEAATGRGRAVGSRSGPRLRAALPGLAAILVVAVGLTAIIGYRVAQGQTTPSEPPGGGSPSIGSLQGAAVSALPSGTPSPTSSAAPAASPVPASAPAFVPPLRAQVKISIKGGPRLVSTTTDAIWVAVDDAGSNTSTLTRIDPRSNLVSTQVPLPTDVSSIAADGRDVWAALKTNQIARVDARTAMIDGTVQVNDPYDLAVRDSSVWVTAGRQPGSDPHGQQTLLVEVDTRTRKVTRTVDLGRRVADVVATANDIWVSGDAIWRIDPRDGRVVSTFNIASRPLAVGPDSVWAVDGDTDIVRLDPVVGHVKSRMVAPFAVRTLYFDGRWLWAGGIGDPTALVQIDPASNQVIAGTALGLTGTVGGVTWDGGIAGGFGSTWICDSGRSELLRVPSEP